MVATVGSLNVVMTVDAGGVATGMSRAEGYVTQGASRIGRAAGVAERSVDSFFGAAGGRSFSPYAMLAVSRGFESAADRAGLLRGSVLALTGVFGGLAAALSTNVLLRYADTYTNLTSQLKTVTSGTADLAGVQGALFDVAQRSRSSLQDTVTIYARTARASEALGLSQEKLLKITETVQKAFAVGGATAQEASGAAIQLSQGIASNRFSGDEFKSVAENAPVLLQGMAKSLDVSIGKLREMAHDGLLTAEVVTKAILGAGDAIEKEFAKTALTVDRAFIQVDNQLTVYVGKVNEAYGITNLLSKAIVGFGNNLQTIIPIIGTVAALTATAFLSRAVTSGVGGIASRIKAERADARDAMAGYRTDIENLIAERKKLESGLVDVGARRQGALTGMRAADLPKGASDDLLIKQMAAEEKVAGVVAKRAAAEQKLASARAGAVSAAGAEVDRVRDALRADQQRISVIQQRIVAEERASVAAAQSGAQDRAAAVAATNAKILTLDQRLAEERASIAARAQEKSAKQQLRLDEAVSAAKVSLADREAKLVDAAARRTTARTNLSDLRGQQNLPGFQETFGKEYDRALKDQGKATNDYQKALSAVATERERLGRAEASATAGASASAAATSGLNSLLKTRETAVASLAVQQSALAESQSRLAAVEAGQVSSGKLTKLFEQESKAVEAYRGRIDEAQKAVGAFQQAQAGAVQTPAMTKASADLAKLDGELKKARTSFNEVSVAVAAANSTLDDTGRVNALKRFNSANQELVGIQRSLVQVGAEMERAQSNMAGVASRATATGSALSVVRNAGASIVGLFGGPWGVALTGAIFLMGALGIKAQETAQEIANAEKLIRDRLEKISAAQGPQQNSALQSTLDLKIKTVQKEMEAAQKQADRIMKAINDARPLQKVGTTGSDKVIAGAQNSVMDLSKQVASGSIDLVEFNKRLGEIEAKYPFLAKFNDLARDNAVKLRAATMVLGDYREELSNLKARDSRQLLFTDTTALDKLVSDFKKYQDLQDKEIIAANLVAQGKDVEATAYRNYNKALADGVVISLEQANANALVLDNLKKVRDGMDQAKAAARAMAEEEAKSSQDTSNKSITGRADFFGDIAAAQQNADRVRQGIDYVTEAQAKFSEMKKAGINITYEEVLAGTVLLGNLKKLVDGYGAAKEAARSLAEEQAREANESVNKSINGRADYFEEVRALERKASLLSKGREVEARAQAKFIELRKAGVQITFDEVMAGEKSSLASETRIAAMKKEEKAAETLAQKLARLKEQRAGSFLGDTDRSVLAEARSLKLPAKDIQGYVAGAQSGDFSQVTKDLQALRDQKLFESAAEGARGIVKQYGDLSQIAPLAAEQQRILGMAVAEGAITAGQAKVAYADYLSQFGNLKFINQTADAFGSFAVDLAMASLEGKKFNDILKQLGLNIARIVAQQTIGTGINSAVKMGLGSLGSLWGGSSGTPVGANVPAVPMSILPPIYDSGGIAGIKAFGPKTNLHSSIPIADSGMGPSNFLSVLEKGEAVLTRDLTKRTTHAMAGLASNAAGGGGGIEMNVNVNNQNGSDVQVEKKKNASGGMDIEVGIKSVVKDGFANGDFTSAANSRLKAPQRQIRR